MLNTKVTININIARIVNVYNTQIDQCHKECFKLSQSARGGEMNCNLMKEDEEKCLKKDIKINSEFYKYFLTSDFKARGDCGRTLYIQQTNEWNKLVIERSNESGIEEAILLKNKILKLNSDLNLKTLGYKSTMKFSMTGESSLWLFSRVKESKLDELTAIIFITKEMESNRKYIHFGIATISNEFQDEFALKSLKRQEIPKHSQYNNQLDTSTFTLIFIDEGESSTSIDFIADSYRYRFEANFYIPRIETCDFLIGSYGGLVTLYSLQFNQIKRKSSAENEYFADKQNCSCCKIY